MLLEDIPSRVAQLIAGARWDSGDAGRILREKDVGKIALEGLPDAFNTEKPERIEDPGILVVVSDRAYRQQILCVEQVSVISEFDGPLIDFGDGRRRPSLTRQSSQAACGSTCR